MGGELRGLRLIQWIGGVRWIIPAEENVFREEDYRRIEFANPLQLVHITQMSTVWLR
jgi:hypothetical protein